ncbi:MAG: deoxyribodipyrimidine photolyase [Acidobacteriota bacterium]
MPIPEIRRRLVNDEAVRDERAFVLYWMIAQRRVRWNFALDHAADEARRLGKPLVVLEALRCGYRWASDRLHRFVLEGMASNARRMADSPVRYLAYVESEAGEGRDLLGDVAAEACLVVTDDYPAFFLPRMVAAAGRKLDVRLEAVDSNGLLPLRAADKAYARAVDMRRFLQKTLPSHLGEFPRADPLEEASGAPLPEAPLPKAFAEGRRYRDSAPALGRGQLPDLGALPIDHGVAPVTEEGGGEAADRRLDAFLESRLRRYQDGRLDLGDRSTSGLSFHLHFGHISTHQIFAELVRRESWQPDSLGSTTRGQREGWWNMSANAESFLDEFVTWRELGYNNCAHLEEFDTYESLPQWARTSLELHLGDERPHLYELDDFERARTHDELWNAAQRELLRTGRIHNYLRMLWGKKIFEWSPTPQAALEVMIELNNKYAVDGRDPNSYSGIFWVLGRHDRAWGPERPIYGKIRYMTSDSARRKLALGDYLDRFGAAGGGR